MKVELFGKEYDKNKLPKNVELDCGCIYEQASERGFFYVCRQTCKIHTPKINIDSIRGIKIQQVKHTCKTYILKEYPEWKQINIILGLKNGKENMIKFIEDACWKCDKFEKELNELKTLKEINNYTYKFS